jgi:hypothetical protein
MKDKSAKFGLSYPERVYDAVARRMPKGDKSNGAIKVRVKINIPEAEAGLYLRPDASAVVTFLKG